MRKTKSSKISFQKCSKIFRIKSATGNGTGQTLSVNVVRLAPHSSKNIKERYTRKNSLEHRHVNEIFQQWLTAIRGNPSNEITNALRNVVVEEFKSVDQNLKPLN